MSNSTQLKKPIESAHEFLDEVYNRLDYCDGNLLDAVQLPQPGTNETEHWLECGEWLGIAKKVNADKVLFVGNNPLIVFSAFDQAPIDEDELLNFFRRVWCMARPQRLFLALPGELQVYGLNQPPIDDTGRKVEPLITVKRVADVLEKLQDYHREHLESGYLPQDDRFGKPSERADRRLIQDLKTVRKLLEDTGLDQEHAHALIGRSIFIRYLEDRRILTAEYFERIAANRPYWQDLLAQESDKPEIIREDEWQRRWYYRVLRDKDFTYALFKKLADDFNGDMFPKDEREEDVVEQKHLDLLRGFLLGDADPKQPNLFFWAYDFEIVPIELISSIYEEFYHKSQKNDTGTHYTPSTLVEFILSKVLTPSCLASTPVILDPACGSGIFLVETFRRIVRYRVQTQGQPLSAIELRSILRDQIRGIEIDQGAAYVTAFSLYLALLHYQEPPDILAQIEMPGLNDKPLSHLLFEKGQRQDANHYHVLFNMNAFALVDAERQQIEWKLEASRRFKGRAEYQRLLDSCQTLPIEPKSIDIIVGNPPWGFANKSQTEIRKAQEQTRRWCTVFDWTIGDNELSQAFIARTLSLLKPGGECGLLVSTGIFFKHHSNSQKFRQRWLEESTIKTIVNFSHVRQAFFNTAIAPFAFVHYKAGSAESIHWVYYWSAKRVETVDSLQSVILSLPDIKQVRQSDFLANNQLWKTCWWGSHRDAALVKALNLNTPLELLADKDTEGQAIIGRGFEGDFASGDHNPSDWLKELYNELPIECFQSYGPFDTESLIATPDFVHRFGEPAVYHGWRLLVKRGITQKGREYRQIESRLAEKPFCFRNSIHGIKVDNLDEWQRKVLLAILWSSLARYYFFMTSSTWGTWHYEIHLEEIKKLPVRFTDNLELRERIIQIVDALRNWEPGHPDHWNAKHQPTEGELKQLSLFDNYSEPTDMGRLLAWEHKLDQAIFDLYELDDAERDLVQDMCQIGLEFFYKHTRSKAIREVEAYPESLQGTIDDLPKYRPKERGLQGYLYAFLSVWNDELSDGEFNWRIIRSENNRMLVVIFTTQEKGSPLPTIESTSDEEWDSLLKRCDEALPQPISRNIYIDGMVREIINDTEIIIIKRNEQRLWTRSMAREDAEATLLRAMYLQEAKTGTR